jgi:hypothetical protein
VARAREERTVTSERDIRGMGGLSRSGARQEFRAVASMTTLGSSMRVELFADRRVFLLNI